LAKPQVALKLGAIAFIVTSVFSIGNFIVASWESSVGGQLAGQSLSRQGWIEVLERASESVFLIEVKSCRGKSLGTGSGFLTDKGVVTNEHVIDDGSILEIRNDKGEVLEVKSWVLDESKDLALIHVGSSSAKALQIAPDQSAPGQLVATVGHPLGGELTIRDGRFHSVIQGDDFDRTGWLMGITAEALKGDSGGPVISAKGEVVGVTTYLLSKANLTLAVPVDELIEFLNSSEGLKPTSPCVATN
jgi:S1-C subfamily serine protease